MTIFGNTIRTPRLILGKTDHEEVPLLTRWSNSLAAHGSYLTADRISLERSLAEHEAGKHWNEQNRTFVIRLKDGVPIGTVHYWLRAEQQQCAVMSVKIAEPAYRNRGFGTEAQKYIIIHLMQKVKVKQVEMYTDIGNIPQQRCLKKLGFDLVESLQYEDCGVRRTGYLYRLSTARFNSVPVYHFHYEYE